MIIIPFRSGTKIQGPINFVLYYRYINNEASGPPFIDTCQFYRHNEIGV